MAQAVWPNSRFDSLWYSGDVFVDIPCHVRMGDGHIEVLYEQDDAKVRYGGTEVGDGHFTLKSTEVDGVATLHMLPGARTMDGYYVEGGVRGMWRIELA